MRVIKTDGSSQILEKSKILARLEQARRREPEIKDIDTEDLADRIFSGLVDSVSSAKIDALAINISAAKTAEDPGYSSLASRIYLSALQKRTVKSFKEHCNILYTNKDQKGGAYPLLHKDFAETVRKYGHHYDAMIDHTRDFRQSYFATRVLEQSFFSVVDGLINDTFQYVVMRYAAFLHGSDLEAVKETYDAVSLGRYIPATPSLQNAGRPVSQMASCFLFRNKKDSINGLFSTFHQIANTSKNSGGVGVSYSDVRARGSDVKGTGGKSSGLMPWMKILNSVMTGVNQGGKRKGSASPTIEPWHADVVEFIHMRKTSGNQDMRARDIYPSLWIPDLLFKRAEQNADWSLFCPSEAPGLDAVWGDEFEQLYEKYEKEGRARKTMTAWELWWIIIDAQAESGLPYLMHKDHCNAKSNHQHLGTIRNTNLCCEIIEYSDPDEISVCSIASTVLPDCVDIVNRTFNHSRLFESTRLVVRNLDKMIDRTDYPDLGFDNLKVKFPEEAYNTDNIEILKQYLKNANQYMTPVNRAKTSSDLHRSIAAGVIGLADVFIALRMPFDSPEAAKLNEEIFETIYYAALFESNHLANIYGTYPTYEGSPVSKGILQFDMWNQSPPSNSRWDWDSMRKKISTTGIRNSLLIGLPPTKTSSKFSGYNESIESYVNNMYKAKVLSGEHLVVNTWLVNDLKKLGLWNTDMVQQIIAAKGSVQNISTVPKDLKALYKITWEIPAKVTVDMAADRGKYICQSQSMNLYMEVIDPETYVNLIFYGRSRGLKTLKYYSHSRPSADPFESAVQPSYVINEIQAHLQQPIKNGSQIQPEKKFIDESEYEEGPMCRMEEGCGVCGV